MQNTLPKGSTTYTVGYD